MGAMMECVECGRTYNLSVSVTCPECGHDPYAEPEPDDDDEDDGGAAALAMPDGGVFVTRHAATRYDERSPATAVAPETAWRRGSRRGDLEREMGCDEVRFHHHSSTLLLRNGSAVITVLDASEHESFDLPGDELAHGEPRVDGGTSWTDLNARQRDVLLAIAVLDEKPCRRDLARHIENGDFDNTDERTVGNAVAALEDDGLVEPYRPLLNQRRKPLQLTADGERVLGEHVHEVESLGHTLGFQMSVRIGGEVDG
jgi:DNA-binding MarR family transcriptional regulator